MKRHQRLTKGVVVLALVTILMMTVVLLSSSGDQALASEPTTWVIQAVDTEGYVGYYTSLAFDHSGNPAISYVDGTAHDLKYAHFNGISWSIERVDSQTYYIGSNTSLAFDSIGNPAISYCDGSNGDLKYAHWDGTGWVIQIIDAPWTSWTSLAFDPQGNPAISYGPNELKYAYWNGSSWNIQTVDRQTGNVGWYTSLAFDVWGNPAMSYHDLDNDVLKYAHWDGTGWEIETVDRGRVGYYASLAFDAQGNPAISYCDEEEDDLKYAGWDGTSWDIETVDSAGQVGKWTSLAFDSEGNPAVSYSDSTALNHALKYAHWDGKHWDIEKVDDQSRGEFTSLAFDSQGNPAISYCGGSHLKYAVDRGLVASFTADTTTRIVEGQAVRFADLSLGEINSWQWNFGDGTPVVEWTADTRPQDGKLCHAYTTKGSYTVSLTVSGTRGIHTESRSNYISVFVADDIEVWAIIIGLSDYEDFEPAPSLFPSPWENYDLLYADDDARGLYEQLCPIWGESHTRLLVDEDATKAGMRDAVLNWLAPQEDAEDIVLFYFSGHGDSSYILPYDSLETSYSNDIRDSELDNWLDSLDSERVVVILDSCESGGFIGPLAGDGRLILTSCAVDESSWAFPELEHGVFTHYLLNSFNEIACVDTNGNQKVSAEEIFNYVGPPVVSYATEQSEEQHPKLYDGCVGELDLFSIVTITSEVAHGIAPITIDGTEYTEAQLPISFAWGTGTTHTLSVPEAVSGGEGTRHLFTYWSDGNTSPSRTVTASEIATLVANYKTQYYLTVESQYGEPQGEAWYDEGSEVTFSVAGGHAWYWTFGGWSGDSEAKSASATIVMDGPKSVIATRTLSVRVWLLAAGVGLVLVSAFVIGILRTRSH